MFHDILWKKLNSEGNIQQNKHTADVHSTIKCDLRELLKKPLFSKDTFSSQNRSKTSFWYIFIEEINQGDEENKLRVWECDLQT